MTSIHELPSICDVNPESGSVKIITVHHLLIHRRPIVICQNVWVNEPKKIVLAFEIQTSSILKIVQIKSLIYRCCGWAIWNPRLLAIWNPRLLDFKLWSSNFKLQSFMWIWMLHSYLIVWVQTFGSPTDEANYELKSCNKFCGYLMGGVPTCYQLLSTSYYEWTWSC